MKKYTLAAACIIAALTDWHAVGLEEAGHSRFLINENASIDEWDNEVERLSDERLALIDDLKRRLRSEIDTEKQVRICFLLGAYKAREAVQDLCGHLTLEVVPSRDYTKLPLWGRWPAQEALVKIGVPATEAIIEKLATSDDLLTRYLCIEFLRRVYGDEIGTVVLEKAIEKENDLKRKGNLEAGRGLPRIHPASFSNKQNQGDSSTDAAD